MNITSPNFSKLSLAVAMTLALAACATPLTTPEGAIVVRQNLTQLKGDRELMGLAPVETQAAEQAVVAAERPEADALLSEHLILLAERKVETARLWAQSRYYEKQRGELNKASEQARLDARTHEAEMARQEARAAEQDTRLARNQASTAQNEAAAARSQADIARRQATSALREANIARMETEQLTRLVSELNARDTERGIIVTLGDVLFATGQSTIIGANDSNLAKLAGFLNQYEERTVIIEGHTDSVGTDSSNMALSQSRANAVKSYLVREGVAEARLSALGKGEGSPISSNTTETGRQQNRRVEVIIANMAPDA